MWSRLSPKFVPYPVQERNAFSTRVLHDDRDDQRQGVHEEALWPDYVLWKAEMGNDRKRDDGDFDNQCKTDTTDITKVTLDQTDRAR